MERFKLVNPYWRQQLVMAGISWAALITLVLLVEPSFVANVVWKGSYLPFFGFLWLGCFWLFTSFSGRWKRSLLWSSSLVGWAMLRGMQLDNWLTVSLLLAFNLVWAYYWKLNNV